MKPESSSTQYITDEKVIHVMSKDNQPIIERVLLIIAAASLAIYGINSDLIGLGLALVVLAIQIAKKKKINVVSNS